MQDTAFYNPFFGADKRLSTEKSRVRFAERILLSGQLKSTTAARGHNELLSLALETKRACGGSSTYLYHIIGA